MTRPTLTIIVGLALVVGVPAMAVGQDPLGVRGFVSFGSTTLTATKSFKAVTGKDNQTGPGFGAEVVNLWRGLFVGVAFSQIKLDGQRVFVNDGTVYQLGIPETITYRPIDAAVGWRIRAGRVYPFFGAGATMILYKETGSFAQSGEDVNERANGFLVMGGVDVSVLRWLHVGGEVRYRGVKRVLGVGGVSEVYGEKDLGGFAVAARVAVGR